MSEFFDANQQRHLANPFYKRVDKEVEAVKHEQILKGADKYPEPFNPKSWTGPQLYGHLMQELRDAQVYGVGLLDYIERTEAENKALFEGMQMAEADIATLKNNLEDARKRADYWEIRAKAAENELIERTGAEIDRLKAIEELYQQEMRHMAKLVEFLNGHYPEVRAGQHCVDAAIELLSKGRNIDLKA